MFWLYTVSRQGAFELYQAEVAEKLQELSEQLAAVTARLASLEESRGQKQEQKPNR